MDDCSGRREALWNGHCLSSVADLGVCRWGHVMRFNREEALKVVTGGLSWIVKEAELRGTIHLFDSHIIAQEVYRRLLNELHGLQLEVTDSIHQNFPGIDLGDEVNKRCFQVTSEFSGRKIQQTLDAYATHALKPRFGKLQVVVIGKRQRTYSLKVPPGMSFDWKKDIIDSKELDRQINAAGTDTILRICAVIEQEIHLPGIGSKDEEKPLQSSKIASFRLPLKFPTLGDSTEVDVEVFGKFSDVLLDALSRCFQHAVSEQAEMTSCSCSPCAIPIGKRTPVTCRSTLK